MEQSKFLKNQETTSPTPPLAGLDGFSNKSRQNSPPLEGQGEVKHNKTHEVRPGYITANASNYPLIKEIRDRLKNKPTEAEKIIWEYLRNKKTGHKIRRQHIIDNYIPDFVCLSKKVIVEIDGKIHLKQKEQDKIRTLRLNELGYDVIRFTNEEVLKNPKLVIQKIKAKLDEKCNRPNPAFGGAR